MIQQTLTAMLHVCGHIMMKCHSLGKILFGDEFDLDTSHFENVVILLW